MGLSTLSCCVLLMTARCWAQYTLQQDYLQGGNFFEQFSFFTAPDPTDGFVTYVDQATAQAAGLIQSSGNQVTISVDDTSTTTTGRQSVRLTSLQSYQSGLFILDLAHMPGSICGTWPAFWTVGPDWPNQGEIDIIEGVNQNTMNAMTLHTGDGCTINNSGFSGTLSTSDCYTYDPNQASNAGCSIDATSSNTYGTGFNNAGGGVYAMELTANSIAVYFFTRASIPENVLSDSPDPSSWGTPLSYFSGDCDFASKFTNQQIVFDVTFCGQWAGAVWPTSSCASQFGSSCENYVGQNPSAFSESYWSINSLKVFENSGGSSGSNPPATTPGTSAAPTQSIGQPTSTPESGPSTIPFSWRPAPPLTTTSSVDEPTTPLTTSSVDEPTSPLTSTSPVNQPTSPVIGTKTKSGRFTTETVTSTTNIQAGGSSAPIVATTNEFTTETVTSTTDIQAGGSTAPSGETNSPTQVTTEPTTNGPTAQPPPTATTASNAAPPVTQTGGNSPTPTFTVTSGPAQTFQPTQPSNPGGGFPSGGFGGPPGGGPPFGNGPPGGFHGGGGGFGGDPRVNAAKVVDLQAADVGAKLARETCTSLQTRNTSSNAVYELEMPAIFKRSSRHLKYHRHNHKH